MSDTPLPEGVQICPGCNQRFKPRQTGGKGRPQVYCSNQCRDRTAQARHYRRKKARKRSQGQNFGAQGHWGG